MDGGCISIWRKEPLSISEKNKLKKYAIGINRQSLAFSIRIEKLIIKSPYSREQVIAIFDSLPKQEITICGFGDFIFMAAEEILKNFGGYLSIGIGETRTTILAIDGEANEVFEKRNCFPPDINPDSFLVDYLFVSNYFNKIVEPEIRELCNLNTYL